MDLSIIVPAYNESEYIENLLRSISDSLSEIELGYEIIVVDNGSSDETAAISKKFTSKVFSIERSSISFARNFGVSISQGIILAFLDADIRITQDWASEIVNQFFSISEQPVVTGARYVVRENASWIEKNWFDPLSRKKTEYINGGNIILSRRSFDLIGGFDTSFSTGEDYKFCADAKEKGVGVVSNLNFIAIHDGYPRTIKKFMKREIWHGMGDFSSFLAFLNSKVAMASMLFGLGHIMLLLSWGIEAELMSQVLLIGIIVIVLFMSYSIFRFYGFGIVIKNVVLCYVYLLSRFFSFFASLKKG